MSLDSFTVTWTTAGERYRFVSPDSLSLPDGRDVRLTVEAWLRLRDVLRMLPDVDAPQPAAALAAGPAPRPTPPNRGKPWLPEEEERLRAAWSAGDEPADIARALGRTRGSVAARLVRFGLLEEAAAGLRYPTTPLPTSATPVSPA